MTKTKKTGFIAQQSTLSKTLAVCSKSLSTNSILPILDYFLFDIADNQLTISSCDLRIIISKSITVEAQGNFKLCLPGAKIRDYIAKCNNGPISFEVVQHEASQSVLILSGESKLNIPAEPGEDFPNITNDTPQPFTIEAADWLELMFKTMFAISDDQLRPAFTGLNIHIGGKKMTVMGTDGNRLAVYSLPIDTDLTASFIIGKSELSKIQSLSPTGLINIGIGKTVVDFLFNDTRISARLIDEKCVDYLPVIPIANHINFSTSRMSLITALNRVKLFANLTKTIRLDISLDSLLITAENIDFSE